MKKIASTIVCGLGALLSCGIQGHAEQPEGNLVDVQSINLRIKVDLYYAKDTNFTGKIVYDDYARAYMCTSGARALSAVQEELEEMGLGLIVLDAYRPVTIQKELWNQCPDEEYVVNPHLKTCRHNYGNAVDVMLVDLSNCSLLPMPSSFFGDPCSRDYKAMPSAQAKRNCKLLELIMEKHGFVGLATEWWHFDYKSREVSTALDISFKELSAGN